eukprot:s448_g5.t1
MDSWKLAQLRGSVAMEDALQLEKVLRQHEEFRQETLWLQVVHASCLESLQQVLHAQHGNESKQAVETVRWALWWTAARCDDIGGTHDMLLCLRLQRLLGSCYIPREAMRVLPGDFLVIPVHIPVWSDEWNGVQCAALLHIPKIEKGEKILLHLLPAVRSCLGLREVHWTERALSSLAGTLEMLQAVSFGDDLCTA